MSDVGPFPIRPSVLRLSGTSVPVAAHTAVAAQQAVAAADIEADNRRAARVNHGDAFSIMTATVVRSLEGGRAAILRPERRRGLVAAAGALGVRAFDANLLIAAVQDRVRRGEDPQDAAVAAMLMQAGRAARRAAGPQPGIEPIQSARSATVFVLGLLLGVAIGGALIAWIMNAR